jgi:tetratricopeptide (TPR) repeat protein
MERISPQDRVVGLDGLASLAYWQADYTEAAALYEDLLGLCREIDDPQGVADALFAMSTTAGWLGDTEQARILAEEARTAYEAAASPRGAARVSGAIAWSTWQAGELEEALKLWSDARKQMVAVGDDGEVRQTDVALAAVLHQLGRSAEALELAADTLERMVASGDASGTVQTLDFIASIAVASNTEHAVRLAAAAARLRYDAGGGLSADSVGLEPVRLLATETLDLSAIDKASEEGSAMSEEDAVALGRLVSKQGVAAIEGSERGSGC